MHQHLLQRISRTFVLASIIGMHERRRRDVSRLGFNFDTHGGGNSIVLCIRRRRAATATTIVLVIIKMASSSRRRRRKVFVVT